MEGASAFLKDELFYCLIEELLQTDNVKMGVVNFKYSQEITTVKHYLDEHYLASITLDELSIIAHMNKYTLIRRFTKIFGVTPYQYLETKRINHAKGLLEQNIDLIDVALFLGFSDQSHFTRLFKSLIGLTPKQYQNIFRESEHE